MAAILFRSFSVVGSHQKQGQKALELFRQMQAEGVKPNSVTFVAVLKACISLRALEEGRCVHTLVSESGWESDVFVGNTLVDMYAKCGSIDDAWRVFNRMPTRDIVSWNCMLAGYAKFEDKKKALELFVRMVTEGVKPNPVTYVVLLNMCANAMALEEGRNVHMQAIESGCESDVVVGNTIVDMYAKCGRMEDAWAVFHRMPTRDVVSWSTMLAGYVKCDAGQKALELFRQMERERVKPNPVSFVAVLSACSSIMALQEGRRVHAQVIENGYESDVFVANTLVDMYAKCGCVEDACRVFHRMPTHDVISWNSMLAGYVKCGQEQNALDLFFQMEVEGVKPNPVTFVVVLNACASLMMLQEGRFVHSLAIINGCEFEVVVANTLVDMYGKCGSLKDAQRVFDRMSIRDEVSWSSMLAGYVKCEEGQGALELFRQMQGEGVKPNSVNFVIVLNACASLMALEEGRRIHAEAIQCGCESDVFVGNTLVDMYSKCGNVEDAWRVFQKMPVRDVVSWNSMLGGFSMHGHGKKALDLFQEMHKHGVEWNIVTFICLLSACSQGGLVEEGIQYFKSMGSVYGIVPTVEHYACMVDLLGRAGRLGEAEEFLRREQKVNEDSIALTALLGACRIHGNVGMGKRIAQ